MCGDAFMFQKRQGLIETELECRNGLVRIPGAKGVYERIFDKPRVERPAGENWNKDAVSEYEVIASSVCLNQITTSQLLLTYLGFFP